MSVSASLLAASGALRVASLNLCADEYLLLLTRPDEVVSVSRLSHDPHESPLWRQGRLASANRGTLESALASRPTLLLTMGGGGRSSAAIARKLSLKTLNLPFPSTIDDVERNMVNVAAALGNADRAKKWRSELQDLRRSQPKRIDAIYLAGGGISLGQKSLGNQWMRLAGLIQRPLKGGRVTLETLTVKPPSLLLRSIYRRDQPSLGQRWLDHPLAHRRALRAVETDGRVWTCAGPLMINEIKRLRGIL